MNENDARAATLAHARQAGRWAREAGRPITSCPMYAMGALGRAWRDAWCAGWKEGGTP